MYADILTYEKIGEVLVAGVFNTRLGAYVNVKVNDNVIRIGFDDLKDCTMSKYGWLLICMLKCTNSKILNGTHAFLMRNVLTCIPTSRGSVVDYILLEANHNMKGYTRVIHAQSVGRDHALPSP